MTTPMGDLPDWQIPSPPGILAVATIDQQATLTTPILQMAQPFRVWGLWLRMSMSTNAAYVAAILEISCELEDGSSNALLELACHVTAANQSQHANASIAVPGFTPMPLGGFWQVNLFTGASTANVFFRASGGLYYSVP